MRLVHRLVVVAALAALAVPPGVANAGWYVGVRGGGPYYYYGRPYYPYYYPYYYGYAPPVVVAPQSGVIVGQSPPAQPGVGAANGFATTPDGGPQVGTATFPPPRPLELTARDPQAEAWISQLRSGDERIRNEAANQLGRRRNPQAVEPLIAALSQDRSPRVRDAAARSLGLIGSPSSLDALQRAAQADDDREVRASARFAADVIRDRLRNR